MAEQNSPRIAIRASVETSAAVPSEDGSTVSTPRVSAASAPTSRVSAPRPHIEQPARVEEAPLAQASASVVTPTPSVRPSVDVAQARVEEPAPQEAPVARQAPRASVAVEPQPAPQPQPQPQPAPQPQPNYGDQGQPKAEQSQGESSQPKESAKKGPTMRISVSEWVHRTFPGHEYAFWGGVIAVLVALLVFAIGIGRVIFIAVLVVVGVAVGQVIDGDPKMINAIRDLIDSDRKREY